MENISSVDKKYQNFLKAYKALHKSIVILEQQSFVNEDLKNVVLSGVIKHFELAYETAWKFLKEYLFEVHGTVISSPRAVFRTCYEYQILSEAVTVGFLDLIDERNLTVHVYDMETAERICKAIENYFFVFDEVAKLENPSKKNK